MKHVRRSLLDIVISRIELDQVIALTGARQTGKSTLIRSLLPEGPTVALYFGTEFCEDRLPDFDDVRAAARDRAPDVRAGGRLYDVRQEGRICQYRWLAFDE